MKYGISVSSDYSKYKSWHKDDNGIVLFKSIAKAQVEANKLNNLISSPRIHFKVKEYKPFQVVY
jgi:hypothetical protein